jgi:hypothetical protein
LWERAPQSFNSKEWARGKAATPIGANLSFAHENRL